jgi:hypothetical protein
MPRRLRLDLTFSLIQQIRLVHALCESAYDIAVPAAELDKFSILRDRFNLRLAPSRPDDVDLAPHVTLVHETPVTAVGRLARPLVFPRAIVDHCRTLWPATRPYRYSFAGLLTDQRRALLAGWLDRQGSGGVALAAANGMGDLLRRQLLRWRGYEPPRRLGDLTIWSSERGRRFPMKAWDRNYFLLLAQSQYVLCPSGDYHWSYRFFEAALCGAMPVVEEASPLYDGFRYRLLADADDGAPWSDADARHNYRCCAERIVLPSVDLDRELARLVAAAPASVSVARARTAPPPS